MQCTAKNSSHLNYSNFLLHNKTYAISTNSIYIAITYNQLTTLVSIKIYNNLIYNNLGNEYKIGIVEVYKFKLK